MDDWIQQLSPRAVSAQVSLVLPSHGLLDTQGAKFYGNQIGHLLPAGSPAFVEPVGQPEDHRAALLIVQPGCTA